MLAHALQHGNELFFTLTVFDASQQVTNIWQSFAAGRTPAAGFAGKELDQVQGRSHQTGLVIEHDDGAGAKPMADFFKVSKSISTSWNSLVR